MHVRQDIGHVFQPDVIQFADALPKTRSCKIMRRILKAIAAGTDIGNVTTLADPTVVDTLDVSWLKISFLFFNKSNFVKSHYLRC